MSHGGFIEFRETGTLSGSVRIKAASVCRVRIEHQVQYKQSSDSAANSSIELYFVHEHSKIKHFLYSKRLLTGISAILHCVECMGRKAISIATAGQLLISGRAND